MSKGKKFVAGCCIAIGVGMIFAMTGIAMGGRVTGVSLRPQGIFVYTPQGAVKGEKTIFQAQAGEETLEKFDSIKMDVDYAVVCIQPGENYEISYRIDGMYKFSYEVKNGELVVTQESRSGMNFFSFGYSVGEDELHKEQMITIRVPKDSAFSSVNISNDYGDIVCGDFTAEKLKIDSDYGNVELGKVGSKNAAIFLDYGDLKILSFSDGDITVESDYGDVTLEDMVAGELKCEIDSGSLSACQVNADSFSIDNDYGDTELETVSAKEVNLTADSGMISLNDVKAEKLIVDSDYGDVKGEKVQTVSLGGDISSGNCEIKELDVKNVKINSEYGDVSLGLTKKLADYNYNLLTEYGHVTLGDIEMKESYQSLEQSGDMVEIYCDSGDIELQGAE